jgi:UDP-2,4-diacetamido-2,4,6-trideoxy-beta-L-altropyranose hydrolase
MKKIVFRADGGSETGWGHLYRSLAIVKMLHQDFDCAFASAAPPEFLSKELVKINVPLVILDKVAYPPIGSRQPGEEVPFDMDHLLSGTETVVLDGYWFGSQFQLAVKNKGCALVYIDDLHEGVYYADLIVNQSPGVTEEQYTAQAYTKFAFGLGFAMLRPSFLEAAASGNRVKKENAVFICFGGADPLQLTRQSLEVAGRQPAFEKIYCVTAVKDDAACDAIAAKDKRIQLLYQLSEDAMCAVMTACKYAVVPSSALLIEAIACGMEPVTCFYAQNQQDFHSAMLAAGIQSTGWVDENYTVRLGQLLQEIQKVDSSAVPALMKMISGSKNNFIEQFKRRVI